MGISIQSLRVFLCVLEQGSLSGAGRELKMTQPAVSNHLHSLEQKFGVVLISRGRPLRATCAGECLAERARRVLAEIEALEEDMARHTEPRGRLVVGASSTPGELLLPRVATEFAASYPDVALDVRIDDTESIIAALLDREIEVGVVGHEVDDHRLSASVIEQDELVPVTAACDHHTESDIEPAKLSELSFVMRERGSGTRQAVEEVLAAAGVRPRVAIELGSNAAVVGAVAAGAGIGVVPKRTLGSENDVRPLRVRGVVFSRPFVLITEHGRPLSPAAEAFIKTTQTGKEIS